MLLYFPTINKYLTKVGFLSEEFLDYALDLEKEWEQSQKKLSPFQLLEIFPEAKSVFKRTLLKEIDRSKKDLQEAEQIRIEFNSKVLKRIPLEDRWFASMVRDIFYVNPLKDGQEKKIKRNLSYLSALKPGVKELKNNKITDADIIKAKEIPLESLYFGNLMKRNGILVGYCCFHNDKHRPNFTIYTNTNRFICFSCGVAGSSVDFIMKRDSCGFIQAVKTLIGK